MKRVESCRACSLERSDLASFAVEGHNTNSVVFREEREELGKLNLESIDLSLIVDSSIVVESEHTAANVNHDHQIKRGSELGFIDLTTLSGRYCD